MLEVPWGCNK